MNLYKEDIKRIGNSTYNENGFTCFICNGNTSNIEYILLREILQEIGNYKILSEDDFMWDNGQCDIEIKTNLPFDIYLKLDR